MKSEDSYSMSWKVLRSTGVSLLSGHEYSLKNLQFAASVEPQNAVTLKKLEDLNKAAAYKHTSVGETIQSVRISSIAHCLV